MYKKSRIKRRLTAAGIPALAAVFLLTGCGLQDILRLFGSEGEKEKTPVEIAEEIESVDYDRDTGLLYVNSDVILVAREDAPEEKILKLAEENDAAADCTMSDISVYRLAFQEAMTYEELEAAVQRLREDPLVEDARFNIVTSMEEDAPEDGKEYSSVYPEDSWEEDDWDAEVPRGKNWGLEAIHAPAAWGYLGEMSTVRVGIIDSMPDTAHPDLIFEDSSCLFVDTKDGSVEINKYPVEARDHGTHVAGIIGADWNNGEGISGVTGDRGELYYSAVYYDNDGTVIDSYATAYSYVLALKSLIDRDVRVINISQNTGRLEGFAASHGNENAVRNLREQAELTEICLDRIIRQREESHRPDFLICVAAGNSNSTEFFEDPEAPWGYSETPRGIAVLSTLTGEGGEKGGSLALYNNFLSLMDLPSVRDRVIVAGSVGIDEERSTEKETICRYSEFSNVGDRVDIVAPGENIYSCTAGGYGEESGTSMAAPHVSGTAGLVFAVNPELSGPDVKKLLLSSAEGRYYYEGGFSGMVNARSAVEKAMGTRSRPVEKVLSNTSESPLDLCFVIDTTSSMGDDIDNARENMLEILHSLGDKTTDYRVAIIDYRDFYELSRDPRDYASKVQLSFTSDEEEIVRTIGALKLGFGGDTAESVYSGLMEAAALPWKPEARKVIIVLGDAPPHDPEPFTEYTYYSVLEALKERGIVLAEESDQRAVGELDGGAISVYAIGPEASEQAADFFREIASDTGGSYSGVESAEDVSTAIQDSIEQIQVDVKVSVTAEFGEELAEQEISLFREGGFLFSFRTDSGGSFYLKDMSPGTYDWKCPGGGMEGKLVIREEQDQAELTRQHTETAEEAPQGGLPGLLHRLKEYAAFLNELAERLHQFLKKLPF